MKIGILGVGNIGKRHLSNVVTSGHEALCYEPSEGGPIEVPLGSIKNVQFLPRNTVLRESDAIIIASPTCNHLTDLSDCILHKKPTLIEKPIGNNLQSATSLVKEAELIGLPITVGYNLRFHPCVTTAKRILEIMGEPLWARFICSQFNNRESYLRDGVTLNWSHEIDLAIHLLGSADLTFSSTRLTNNQDDMVDIHLIHKRAKCHTNIHLDYITKPEVRGFEIACAEGIISANLPDRSLTIRKFSPSERHQTEKFGGSYDIDYKEEMVDFIRLYRGGQSQRSCSAREALEVLKICTGVKQQAGLK